MVLKKELKKKVMMVSASVSEKVLVLVRLTTVKVRFVLVEVVLNEMVWKSVEIRVVLVVLVVKKLVAVRVEVTKTSENEYLVRVKLSVRTTITLVLKVETVTEST